MTVGGVLRLCLAILLPVVLAGPLSAQTPPPIGPGAKPPALRPIETKIKCGSREGTIEYWYPVNSELRVGDGPPEKVNDGVRITYVAKGCTGCSWVQFLWRELISHRKIGGDERATSKMKYKEGGSEYPYTDDVNKPEVHVDAPPGTNPAYPGQTNGESATSFIDSPTSTFTIPTVPAAAEKDKKAVERAEAAIANISELEEIAHLDAYLVCDGVVCGHVAWTKTWSWKPGEERPGTGRNYAQSKLIHTDTEKPTKAMRDALDRQFPGQALVK